MATYGIALYGMGVYGVTTLPTSDPWDIFDFCEPTDATMLTIMAHPEVSPARWFIAPQYSFNGANDLCLFSDDGLNSGLEIAMSVPPTYSLQFTILPTALPDDFSSLGNERFWISANNQYGKMSGLLLSENGGLAMATDSTGTDFTHLIDSADLFDSGAVYYTFRVTVNGTTGRMNVYVTPTTLVPVIGHQLKITTQALDTPTATPDGVVVEVYGSAANPTTVCLDCLRLSSKEVIPNFRPVADPGVDQTRPLYQFAAFDGRGSYDPEGGVLRYWWTIVGAPETSDMWLTGVGTTPVDVSGYTNRINGSVGDFSDVAEGDLAFIEDQKSTIKFIASDGSYVVAVDHVFVHNTSNASWSILKQSAWDGNWNASSVSTVLAYTNNEPVGPSIGDTYLVGGAPVGGVSWVAASGELAEWDGVAWVATALPLGSPVYSVADVMSYRLVDIGPYLWVVDDPEPWELAHWDGRTNSIGTMLPDKAGAYKVELVVNDGTSMILPPVAASSDGSLNSIPAEALLSVSASGSPIGLVPDLSFIWNYLSNFWTLVEGKEKIETVWSGTAQILAGDMLELWQHDYAKGLFDVQRQFQRRWRGYDLFVEEPNYDDSVYAAEIDISVNEAGYSATPGFGYQSYDIGTTVPSSIDNGHLLVLGNECYEVARTKFNVIITKDDLPETEGARIYANAPTGTFVDGETVTGGVSLATATVTSGGWNFLVVASPSAAFTVGETITGSLSGATAIVTGYNPPSTQRPRFWRVPPVVTSKSTDFTAKAVYMGDTAIFDVYDNDTEDYLRVNCFIYGARGRKLAFDPTNIAPYLADPDRYTTRFYGVLRRNYISIDTSIMSLSSLCEVVDVDSVEGAPPVLVGNNDFIVETLNQVDGTTVRAVNLLESFLLREGYGYDGDTSTTPSGKYFDSPGSDFITMLGAVGTDISDHILWIAGSRYRLLSVTSSTRLELEETALTTGLSGLHWRILSLDTPPDRMWAETTYIDNRETIEANFGSRVGFTLDDLAARTDDLDYLSAVQGLWYAFWNGATISNVRTACQVLLGLPFSEVKGTITDIRTPFDTKYNRVLVSDAEDDLTVRSYKFPVSLSVDTNPDTGVAYQVGDTIEQFAPICTGVVVEDYVSNPTWMENIVGSGDLNEAQKVHTFGVTIDSSAFNYTNITFLINYLVSQDQDSKPYLRPHYTHPAFIVVKSLDDVVDVEDALLLSPAHPPEKLLSPGTYYTYPDNVMWEQGLISPVPSGWADSPAYPPTPQNWSAIPVYDTSTRWPSNRFTDVPPRMVDYGGLHVEDVAVRVPDPWSGAWPQTPTPAGAYPPSQATHTSTEAEGTFRIGDTDEGGHFIHVIGTSHSNLLSDGDMEDGINPGGAGSPWSLVNYGGSAHPLTCVKSGAAAYDGVASTQVSSIGPGLGMSQSATVASGRQVAARFQIRMISGQAHALLLDGATTAAEWRLVQPIGSWAEITMHLWSATNATFTLAFVTGPAGGDFYVDAAGLYSDAVPWTQWGIGRTYVGRTGGYTIGGSPDENLEYTLYSTVT